MSNTPGRPDGAPPAFLGGVTASFLWDVLTNETSNRVVVFDQSLRFVYANAETDQKYAAAAGRATIIGLSMADVVPASYYTLMAPQLRRAMNSPQPVVIESTLDGVRLRTLARRLPTAEPLLLVVSRNVSDRLPDAPAPAGTELVCSEARDLGPLSHLTERELEVLRLIGEGLSTAAIAETLHRSVKTIEWHRASLGAKLGVANRVELARIAIQAGLCGLGRHRIALPAANGAAHGNGAAPRDDA